MENRRFRGVKENIEVNPQELRQDLRKNWERIFDEGLKNRIFFIGLVIVILALSYIFPILHFILIPILAIVIYKRCYYVKYLHLPMRVPRFANTIDYGDPKPGRTGFFKSNGIFYIGRSYPTDRRERPLQLWAKLKDTLTHFLVLGTTGSGKTEALLSFCANFLALNSGYIYGDPKGTSELVFKHFALTRMFGRDDDFRVLNYSIQAKPSANIVTPERISNSLNLFAYGSAEMMSQILISLLPSAEGQNAVFVMNAQTLISSLMYPLRELRDIGKLVLTVKTLREYLGIEKYVSLLEEKSISEGARQAVLGFLKNIGYQEGKPVEKQPRNFHEQYAYAVSYFNLAITTLVNSYGHVYDTKFGEVSPKDIIKNRKIWVFVMPSLEKSKEETKNVGGLVLSSIKTAIAISLGGKLEGTVEEILDSLPTASETPFGVITDEHAAISTPGYAEVATQSRSLGICAIISSQDVPGLKKADEGEFGQFVANTKTKIGMNIDDPETFKLFDDLAGSTYVAERDSYELDGEISERYADSGNLRVTEKRRLFMRDMQEMVEGEFFMFFKGKVIPGSFFYADPPIRKVGQCVVHELVEVDIPEKEILEKELGCYDEIIRNIEHWIKEGDITIDVKVGTEGEFFKEAFKYKDKISLGMQDYVVGAFYYITNKLKTIIDDVLSSEDELAGDEFDEIAKTIKDEDWTKEVIFEENIGSKKIEDLKAGLKNEEDSIDSELETATNNIVFSKEKLASQKERLRSRREVLDILETREMEKTRDRYYRERERIDKEVAEIDRRFSRLRGRDIKEEPRYSSPLLDIEKELESYPPEKIEKTDSLDNLLVSALNNILQKEKITKKTDKNNE